MTQNIIPVLDAPNHLEARVKATLDTQATFRREAAATAAIATALVSMASVAANDLSRRPGGQRKNRGHAKPRIAPPMSAIRLGRMAEVAWELLSDTEKKIGMPLWKLASLANLHFIPVPDRKLHALHGSIMVHTLVRPFVDQGGEAPAKGIPKADRRFGFAFVSRALPGTPSQLLGVKIFDHEGRVLMVAGEAPMADHEKVSPFTEGIFNGVDELPANWVYRTKAQQPSTEITEFIAACMPRRQEL